MDVHDVEVVKFQSEEPMSDKVIVLRYPGPAGQLHGPSRIVMGVDEVARALAKSGFMMPWLIDQVKAALASGTTFRNRGAELSDTEPCLVSNGSQVHLRVRSEYRIATKDEVLSYVETQEYANVTGHRMSKRAQETQYALHYHEGPELIQLYEALPKQARILLDILDEAQRDVLTEASIEVILTEQEDRLKTTQGAMKIWGYYRSRLRTEGHVEEIE